MAESKTSPRRLEAHGKHARAIQLRIAGATLQQIADELGYAGPSGAHEAIQRGLDKTMRPGADELRDLYSSRLDRLLLGIWDKASKGNLLAVDRAVRVIDRMAKLHGVDAPIRIKDETPADGWRVALLKHIESVDDDEL
jgi:hypothetical protein